MGNLFERLGKAIEAFILEVSKHRLRDMATEEWTVKDELSHIVFWHNYYAQNFAALAAGKTPFIFKGDAHLNQRGVDELRSKTMKELVAQLHQAQKSLYKSIVVGRVPKMTYKIGREYTTKDFLIMITKHIQSHTTSVRRAK